DFCAGNIPATLAKEILKLVAYISARTVVIGPDVELAVEAVQHIQRALDLVPGERHIAVRMQAVAVSSLNQIDKQRPGFLALSEVRHLALAVVNIDAIPDLQPDAFSHRSRLRRVQKAVYFEKFLSRFGFVDVAADRQRSPIRIRKPPQRYLSLAIARQFSHSWAGRSNLSHQNTPGRAVAVPVNSVPSIGSTT